MKKIALLFSVMLCTGAVAQKAAVQTAYNYLRYEELDKAKAEIDKATVNETTSGSAKTWYYRGTIYHALYESNKPEYAALKPGSLDEAVKAYEKTMELDTKKEYNADVLKRLDVAASQTLNNGVEAFRAENYGVAKTNFLKASEIRQRYFNVTDSLAIYNAALSADRAGLEPEARKIYQKCTEIGYGGAKTYSLLGGNYLQEKDTASALSWIQKGRLKYPEDGDLIIQELNIYLSSGRDKEALAQLDAAITKQPGNANLYYAKGVLSDKLGNQEVAIDAYRMANQINPEYFDAQYNLGALYFNQGAEIANKANALPSSKQAEYDKLMKEAGEKFKMALPYLEKARQINPNDSQTLNSLRQLYIRTGDMAKADEMKRLMEGTR